MASSSEVVANQSAVRGNAAIQKAEMEKTSKLADSIVVQNEARKTASQMLRYLLGVGNPPTIG
jgi:hypothetical protein